MTRLLPLLSLLLLAACGRAPGAADLNGTLLDPPMPGKGFRLASAGGPIEAGDFHGRFVVLAFGYTACPDVCPNTLSRLAQAVRLLGDEADQVQVVFISLDPERDAPDEAARYAAVFDRRFVGASGTPQQIADVAGAYGIFYQKAEGESEAGYLLDHTATVIVLDREGRSRLIWSYDTDAEAMAADLRTLIART